MATKKQLINRWLEEPGRTIVGRIRQMLLDYADSLGSLGRKAFEATGLYQIPKEWLPAFDTKEIFAALDGLPYRDEIPNGRDLRGIPSIGGNEGWDFSNADFSFLPGDEGYSFCKCNLDAAIFDGSKGEFGFQNCSLRGTRFRKVRFVNRISFGGRQLQCDFTKAEMTRARFIWTTNGRDLLGMDLRGSSFDAANLKNAGLSRCDLRECRFVNANLSGASIQEAIVDKSTDFRGANLKDLWWQERRDNSGHLFLRATDWRQGTYDSTTIHD